MLSSRAGDQTLVTCIGRQIRYQSHQGSPTFPWSYCQSNLVLGLVLTNPPPWLASGYTAVHFLSVSRQSPDLCTRSSLGDNQWEYIKHIRGKNVTVKKRNPSKSAAKKRGAREANTGNTRWHWGVRVRVYPPRTQEQVSPDFQKFTLYHFDFYRIPA